MVQGQFFLKEGLALFNFFKVYNFYIEEFLCKVMISCRTQPTSADISSRRLVDPAADDDLVICQNARVDNCLSCQADARCVVQLMMTLLNYTLQNCEMHLKKKNFYCHHNFMKKRHSKLSKNEPENIP